MPTNEDKRDRCYDVKSRDPEKDLRNLPLIGATAAPTFYI